MQRKGNPSALLVDMQTSEATVENSMEFPQKTKNGSAFCPSDSTPGIIPQESWNTNSKNLNTPMFIAAQFAIANYWKQPKSPSENRWIKNNGAFTQQNTT